MLGIITRSAQWGLTHWRESAPWALYDSPDEAFAAQGVHGGYVVRKRRYELSWRLVPSYNRANGIA